MGMKTLLQCGRLSTCNLPQKTICQNISLMCCLSECFQAYFVIDQCNIDSHHIQIEHPLPSD